MKMPITVVALLAAIIGAGYGFNRWQNQGQLLQAYEQHVQNLLADVETLSRQRLQADSQAKQLSQELDQLRSQLDAGAVTADSLASPATAELVEIEQRIRREVQRQVRTPQPLPATTTSLLRQLSQLNPEELGELLTLQGRYGTFLQALNEDDARMETIVNGLSNLIAEQNSARMELMMEMQQQPASRQEFRERMRALDDPAAQAQAMSFILTPEEQALFETLLPQTAQGAIGTRIFGSRRGDGATFISGTEDGTSATSVFIANPDSSDNLINYQIMTAEPARAPQPRN